MSLTPELGKRGRFAKVSNPQTDDIDLVFIQGTVKEPTRTLCR